MSTRVETRAPTRIDFGGGWTDVPPYPAELGGFVCNVAISRHAAVELRTDPAAIAGIDEDGQRWSGTPDDPGGPPLVRAALRRAGVRGVALRLRSDFPAGAGLGGSSAAGVALAAALAALQDERPSREDLAERSREVEVEELGIAGGRQDHYAAAIGGVLALTFHADRVGVRRIPLAAAVRSAFERRCIVAYTGESRISGETITAVIDAFRARDPGVTRALGQMKALGMQMADALERGDLDGLGVLVGEHWEHQRSLHPRITTEGIERVLAAARKAGAIGGKALGASGGGCVVVIAAEGREEEVQRAVTAVATPLAFAIDTDGVRIRVTSHERSTS